MEYHFLPSALLSIALVITTIIVHYEILRAVWVQLPFLRRKPRRQIIFIVIAIFVAHTIAVWTYGAAFWFLETHMQFGALEGAYHDGHFLSYIYFSAATYSSLGLGDMYPVGPFRMLASVEVLNGLLLIGWSVTFTYFAMQQFWGWHISKMTQQLEEVED
ncbi:MAG: two pore domain potassium channel family protein [Rickettsiales bacterium]|nr:two pore domain potassium channel family protein [Rickettsiales bacterium]